MEHMLGHMHVHGRLRCVSMLPSQRNLLLAGLRMAPEQKHLRTTAAGAHV
jgi:hypothetical protein